MLKGVKKTIHIKYYFNITNYSMASLDEYIKEWISIENIAADKKFGQQFLEDLNPDMNDKCSEKNLLSCSEEDSSCVVYHSSRIGEHDECVSKTRVKRFVEGTEENPTIITGKNRRKYIIIHSDEIILTTSRFVGSKIMEVDISIYYYVLVSKSTKNIYILFSTGSILSDHELNDEMLLGFLEGILYNISYLYENVVSESNKIVLCGHSMGCVLALSVAQLLKNRNTELFDSKIVVVGSSPTKFLTPQDKSEFHNLPNIKIFVYCDKKEGPSIYLDCFVNIGSKNRSNYEPLTIVGPDNSEFTISNQEYIINYISDKLTCISKHKWRNYYKILISLYPLTRTGGKTRRLKYNKRRKKHKTRNSV